MDFKNIAFAVIAFIAFNSCQKIEPVPPAPIVIKDKVAVVATVDTVYKTPACNTSASLYVNGSPYIYLDYKFINYYSNRMNYMFQDGLATVSVTIYMKPQVATKKKFEIIPYNSNYNFANYAQAMVVINTPSLGRFEAQSGSLNFLNNSKMGFCGVQIVSNTNKTRTFDFTY